MFPSHEEGSMTFISPWNTVHPYQHSYENGKQKTLGHVFSHSNTSTPEAILSAWIRVVIMQFTKMENLGGAQLLEHISLNTRQSSTLASVLENGKAEIKEEERFVFS